VLLERAKDARRRQALRLAGNLREQSIMTNARIAAALDQVAALIAGEESGSFRAAAYRRAARALRGMSGSIAERYAAGGLAALDDVPGIGPGIARTIAELIDTGHLARLEGGRHPRCEAALTSVPGIGPVLAHRIHDALAVHTLEELRAAANDGRLERLPGLAARRVRGVREALAGRLGPWRPAPRPARPQPPVAELLDVDHEYRDKAGRGLLLRIAPHRFNPTHEAWLPVLRTARGPRRYTALFSNTETAHRLGKTGDWVVLYVDDGEREREATVVTETRGPLAGRRVVRGREAECGVHYDAAEHATSGREAANDPPPALPDATSAAG
jgi:hypothetical protein